MSGKNFGLWAVLAFLWGSSFMAIGVGVASISPLNLVAGRMALAAIVLIAILYARGGSLKLTKRGWAIASIVGVTGNAAPFFLIGFAEQHVASGLAALIMGIAPVITIAVAPLFHRSEIFTATKAVGAALGFTGLLILVGPDSLIVTTPLADPDLNPSAKFSFLPHVALVAAALCYAFTALITRRYAPKDPLQTATASVLFSAGLTCFAALLLYFWGDRPVGATQTLNATSIASLLALVYLGLGPTALGAVIFFTLIPRIGAARVQQVNYAVPILGTILGVAFLGEELLTSTLVTLPVIVAAIYLVSRQDPRETFMKND